MTFDLEALLRVLKPEKSVGQLKRRADKALRFVAGDTTDNPLLLDTTVYIDQLKDRLPVAVRQLLARSVINHSSIAVIEMVHPFGRLDPTESETAANLDKIRATIAAISANRLLVPSLKASVQASGVAGVMARRGHLVKTDKQPFIHDATLYFQALETGSVLLTRNIVDLDLRPDPVDADSRWILKSMPIGFDAPRNKRSEHVGSGFAKGSRCGVASKSGQGIKEPRRDASASGFGCNL